MVRKGEISCNKQFILFSLCCLSYMALIYHFKCTLEMLSAICFNLDQSIILSSGNELSQSEFVLLSGVENLRV